MKHRFYNSPFRVAGSYMPSPRAVACISNTQLHGDGTGGLMS
jgi:hypothetical protein